MSPFTNGYVVNVVTVYVQSKNRLVKFVIYL